MEKMVRTGRKAGLLAAVLVGCLLAVSACSADSNPTPSAPPSGAVVVDQSAKLVVSPVDYGGIRVVAATFGTAVPGRPVVLEKQAASGWEKVSTGKEDDAGRVDFMIKNGKETYRAVAQPMMDGGMNQQATSTPAGSAGEQWRSALSTKFSGKALDTKNWDLRFSGVYDAGGRHCSAPQPSNVAVKGGSVELAVTQETAAANVAKAKAAGCTESNYYRNAMITTETKFTVGEGTVAARVKFPEGQGMHGSVWLQSYDGLEIDMIESYGYGRGLTSVVHVKGKRHPGAGKDTYVNTKAVKDKAWWSKFHVYSAQWDASEVTFRIDGVETQRIKQPMGTTDYFLIISLLSSDWEQKRFTDPVRDADGVENTTLPQTMSVDWVKAWTPA